ncbi:hypothetical protein DAPPUDRAFT_303608 [Daphnia pulex]|uniref:Rotamase n=1 Tax=Daphnia pulex TaxID=6669 RepID=E9GHA0_DAPPU|nr:hypothetical protein DAPPUDRAFT_303608 [Daphnia pulex]|eukprot:EFX81161.1 hypothetical protein DAPPUDRAFT_303608 [Daphnia pulex]
MKRCLLLKALLKFKKQEKLTPAYGFGSAGNEKQALKDEKATEREQLMLAEYQYQAMCCLKLNYFCATRDHCHKALEMDRPKNGKGLFRIMGQALLGIHEPEEAKKHFEAILQFDSNNKAAANQLVICNAKIREQREKDKKLYSSIFNKMAENDRQKALRNKAMDMPEPTQWYNEDSENTTAVELQDYLDSVPCIESEDSEGSDEN